MSKTVTTAHETAEAQSMTGSGPGGSPWRTMEEVAKHYRITVDTARYWRT
jgi:hypothetical protein